MKKILSIVSVAALLILFFYMVRQVVFANPGEKFGVADPAIVVVLEGEATANVPGEGVITLKKDSTIDGCRVSPGTKVAEYVLATRSFHVFRPCNRLFSDGFEGWF